MNKKKQKTLLIWAVLFMRHRPSVKEVFAPLFSTKSALSFLLAQRVIDSSPGAPESARSGVLAMIMMISVRM